MRDYRASSIGKNHVYIFGGAHNYDRRPIRAAQILEPRFAQGHSGSRRPDFGVTISTLLPTGPLVHRVHFPAEDGGRRRRWPRE